MKTKLFLPALILFLFWQSPLFAAESSDFMIIDESMHAASTTSTSSDFILDAATFPAEVANDFGDIIVNSCGDNIRNNGETCDGNDFGSVSCITLGYSSGILTCANDCQLYSIANCRTVVPSSNGGGGGSQNSASPKASPPKSTPTPLPPVLSPSPVSTAQAKPTAAASVSPTPTAQLAVRPQTPLPSPTVVSPANSAEVSPASYLEFGSEVATPSVVTEDASPLIAGNIGIKKGENFLQIIDPDGNIITQSKIVPNQNGAFAFTPNIELPPGEYSVSVYDITVPNSSPLWQQQLTIAPTDTNSQTLAPQPIQLQYGTMDSVRKVSRFVEDRVRNGFSDFLSGVLGQTVETSPNDTDAIVSHVALGTKDSLFIPLDKPLNLGAINKNSNESLIIRGKAEPNAKVIIYFEREAPGSSGLAANLLYNPEREAYYYEAIADDNGVFEIPISKELPEGDYTVRTAVIKINAEDGHIVLGADRQFSFTLFTAPILSNSAKVNSTQSFLVSQNHTEVGLFRWFPILIGAFFFLFLSIFSFHKLVTVSAKKPNPPQQNQNSSSKKTKSAVRKK